MSNYIELLDIGGYDCTCSIILHQGESVENLYGYCDWDPIDKLAEIHIAMGSPAWGITLAHEMVHVKQFARGEMDLGLTRWKSNHYAGNIEYWDQPWEKEARRLQHKLAMNFSKEEWA